MKKYIINIGICVTSIALYLAIGLTISIFISDSVFLTTITDIIISIVGLTYYRKKICPNNQSVKSDKNTWLYLIEITFGLWIITQITITWYYNTFGDRLLDVHNSTISISPTIYLFLTLVFAPIAEEVLIRGIVYPTLKNICKPWIATLISSFIFSFLHGTVVHLFTGIYCGIYFVFVYEYTGKLRYAILAHMIYNSMSLLLSGINIPKWCFTTGFVLVSNIILIAIFTKFSSHLNKHTDLQHKMEG